MQIRSRCKKAFTAVKKWFYPRTKRLRAYLARRPHRSFRLTRRRDYHRTLILPGYFAFTKYVAKILWQYKKIFALLGILFMILFALLAGWQSQSTYTSIYESMSSVIDEATAGSLEIINKAGLLIISAMSSVSGSDNTELQQAASVMLVLLLWLTSVWLLRNLLAGHKVRLRDGLYSAGSPIIPTLLIALLMTVQLMPAALAVIGYSAASSTGLLDSGIAAMLFWMVALLLCVLSLYWWTSSIFALVIVTLPGMYPYQAIKIAGDLVLSYRVRILFRWLWMVLLACIAEVIILLPAIFIDMALRTWLPSVASWLPVVPFVLLASMSFIIIWVAAYVYLLYRKLVDNEMPIGQDNRKRSGQGVARISKKGNKKSNNKSDRKSNGRRDK